MTPRMSLHTYKCHLGTKLPLVDNHHYIIQKVEEIIWTLLINIITILYDGDISPYFGSVILQKYKYFFYTRVYKFISEGNQGKAINNDD